MIKVISKRDLLNEALGVPDGLPETARQIYYDIINNILPFRGVLVNNINTAVYLYIYGIQ
jgi:hypothetical protein